LAATAPAALCNTSVAPVASKDIRNWSAAGKFELPQLWMESCKRVPGPPFAAHWQGQNWCWEWVKHEGCYAEHASLSWYEAQERVADQGLAPFPDVSPLQALQRPELCDRGAQHNGTGRAEIGAAEAEAAKVWMRDTVAVYVLNLATDTERLQSISANLQSLGVDFTRVEGVDLASPDARAEALSNGLVPSDFSLEVAQQRANTNFQSMDGILGTVGCAAAHLNAMSAAVAGSAVDARQLALILEDDVVLEADFVPRLRRLLEAEAPCDWTAISLKSQCPFGRCVSRQLSRVLPDVNEPADRCRHGVNYGFFAMLYKQSELPALRSMLAKTVWDQERPHCLDVDVALASISDKVAYYAVPSSMKPGFLTTGSMGSARTTHNKVKLGSASGDASVSPSASAASSAPAVAGTGGDVSVRLEGPAPPAALIERPACESYLSDTGCGWTASFGCPGQVPHGSLGEASDDGSLGYRCCCEYRLWRENRTAAS